MYTGSFDDWCRTECVVGIDLHSKALGNACHVAAHIPESEDAQLLSHQFGSRLAIIEIAYGKNEKSEHKFGNGIGVLSGSVLGYNMMGRGGFKVDVVIAGTGPNDDFQLFGCAQHFFIHLVRTDNQRVGILHSIQELCFFRVFFKQGHFVSCKFYFFANTFNSLAGERFFCCY